VRFPGNMIDSDKSCDAKRMDCLGFSYRFKAASQFSTTVMGV